MNAATGTDGARALAPAALFLAAAAVVGALSTAFLEADDVAHYEYSRWCLDRPEKILDVWGRPLVTLFYCVPAQFGPEAARLWSLVTGAAAALLAAALARRLGAARPVYAAIATLAMPYAFVQSYAIMTELLFSVILAAGVLLYRRGRPVAAALVWTWLPAARPEGFFLGLLFGVLFLCDGATRDVLGPRFGLRRFATATMLGFGTACWWLAGLPHYRVATWLLDRWPKNWAAESPYGEGRPHPLLFTGFLALVVTPPLIPAFVAGVRRAWGARRRFEVAVVAFVVLLHSVLWTFRLFGSAGYPRYLVILAPLLGALIGLGLDRFADAWARRRGGDPTSGDAARRERRLPWIVATLLLAAVFAWPNTRPWHGDVDVATLKAAARWALAEEARTGRRPYYVADHPAFRLAADVDGDAASCHFERLPLSFAPVGAVAIWETKFAARYSKARREDLLALGFEEIPRSVVAGDPPYPWDGPRPPFPDPELDGYDWGVFVRRR